MTILLSTLLLLSLTCLTCQASVFPLYTPCPSSSLTTTDSRRFYLSTFKTGNDTLVDWKFRLEGQGFNNSNGGTFPGVSGLQDIGIAGKELRFWKKKFFNHPLSSLRFVREAIKRERYLGYDPNNAFSMHVDYDTVLTGISMSRLWEKFDCARKGKPILIAGETGCLAGMIDLTSLTFTFKVLYLVCILSVN